MIIVVTGQPRHGKSQYSIKLLLDLIADNDKRLNDGKLARDIYCNIAGVNAPNTKRQLPSVQNQDVVFAHQKLWFGEHKDCPDGYVCPARGSVFIYDECHKLDWIKETSGTLSTNPTCISMNEHGHEDYIFILITQFPQYIHTHLRGLVEYHYHAKRFNGSRGSKIYKWNEFTLNPRADKSLKDAYEVERFRFDKRYQECYQSASAHDSMRFNLPKPFIYIGLGIIFLGGLLTWRYLNSPIAAMVAGQDGATFSGVKPQNQAQSSPNPQFIRSSPPPSDPLSDNAPITHTAPAYDVAELERKYLPEHVIEMQHSDNIRPAVAVSMGAKCKAYNRYGELLSVDVGLCKRMLKDNSMPKPRHGGYGELKALDEPLPQVAQEVATAQHEPSGQTPNPFTSPSNELGQP